MPELDDRLAEFAAANNFKTKGPLCVALVVTARAVSEGLPIEDADLLTESGGQVRGLGKAAVQQVLERHGLSRVLAEEGGRTSRGSIENARKYTAFLNELNESGELDLPTVEKWWIDRVRDYFASKPFFLRFDSASSIRIMVRDLLCQAEDRQREYAGSQIVGTVLQHLVGAKLELVTGQRLEHHGASVADHSTAREGDFRLGDSVIHVTTAPSEALLRKCKTNLDAGLRAWIVTIPERLAVADGLASNLDIEGRIELCDIEQFLTCNLMERGNFRVDGRRETTEQIIENYNRIISECETDPGLKIRIG